MTARPDAIPALSPLADMARGMFPACVGIGVTDPRSVPAPLLAGECAATRRMVPARHREFAAGRAAARQAMQAIGCAQIAVPMGADRAPVWPDGLRGSISHCATACIAVVGPAPAALGIDLEPDAPLDADLIPHICMTPERDWLALQPPRARGALARIIFSAKEAVFKAQYPLTGTVFGFEVLHIALNVPDACFDATFAQAITPFAAGQRIRGHVSVSSGYILTAINLDLSKIDATSFLTGS
jgi:4'-phosphopantetheinyl transferase EntD